MREHGKIRLYLRDLLRYYKQDLERMKENVEFWEVSVKENGADALFMNDTTYGDAFENAKECVEIF